MSPHLCDVCGREELVTTAECRAGVCQGCQQKSAEARSGQLVSVSADG